MRRIKDAFSEAERRGHPKRTAYAGAGAGLGALGGLLALSNPLAALGLAGLGAFVGALVGDEQDAADRR